MAGFITDNAFDAALNYIKTKATHLRIYKTAQPTDYASATGANVLGVKASPTIGNPTNGDSSGRKIVVSAITDGQVTASGTAGWFAITDETGEELLIAQALNATQSVTLNNIFTLTELDITITDPTV